MKTTLKITFFVSSLLVTLQLSAQIGLRSYEIGHYTDINGSYIDGYFDLNYTPIEALKFYYDIGSELTAGSYYDIHGNKNDGSIVVNQYTNQIKFDSEYGKPIKLSPKKCRAFVIGRDSFAVVSLGDVFESSVLNIFDGSQKVFVAVVDEMPGYTFYKYQNYVVKVHSTGEYIVIPSKKKKFIKVASSVFRDFPFLKNQLEKGEYEYENMPSLIKLLKYKKLYEASEKIYFNSSWDEVKKNMPYWYYADIISLKDSKFLLKYYFKDGTPMYEGYFTSFYPHKREDEFLLYYPNGIVRKRIFFQNNKPTKFTTYLRNGNVHRECDYEDNERFYRAVYDLSGKNIIDNAGNGIEQYYDSIAGRELTFEYAQNQLSNIFFVDQQGRKVYQKCEKNGWLKALGGMQSRIYNEMEYPKSSVEHYKHGYALVKCIIEPNGKMSEFKIIKGLDTVCNRQIRGMLFNYQRYKIWMPGKVDGQKVAQEIVIPYSFSIDGFSVYQGQNHNIWMHNDHFRMHMLNQQMMPEINAPKF